MYVYTIMVIAINASDKHVANSIISCVRYLETCLRYIA